MRIRPTIAATSLVALLPALAVVAPAATGAPAPAPAASTAKAAKVTLNDLPASAEVGQRLTVSGRTKLAKPAKGKKPKPVQVTVERQYAGGKWQAVGTDTTDKKGRYSAKVALTQGGQTSFRVVRGGSASAVDSLAVYEWLDLVDQPQLVDAELVETRRTSTIAGTAYPDSYEFPASEAFLIAKADGLCTTFEASTGFLDSQVASVPDGTQIQLRGYAYSPPTMPEMADVIADKGTAKKLTLDLTGERFVLVSLDTSSDVEADAVLASPRVRCNAAALPEFDYEEVPL